MNLTSALPCPPIRLSALSNTPGHLLLPGPNVQLAEIASGGRCTIQVGFPHDAGNDDTWHSELCGTPPTGDYGITSPPGARPPVANSFVLVRDTAGNLLRVTTDVSTTFSEVAIAAGYTDLESIKASFRGKLFSVYALIGNIPGNGHEILFTTRCRGGSNEGTDNLQDHWIVQPAPDSPVNFELIRMHVEARSAYFHPNDGQLPPGMNIASLQPERWSAIVPVGRRHESFDYYDRWTEVGPGSGVDYLWTGATIFTLAPPPLAGTAAIAVTARNEDFWEAEPPDPDRADPPSDEDLASQAGSQDGFMGVILEDALAFGHISVAISGMSSEDYSEASGMKSDALSEAPGGMRSEAVNGHCSTRPKGLLFADESQKCAQALVMPSDWAASRAGLMLLTDVLFAYCLQRLDLAPQAAKPGVPLVCMRVKMFFGLNLCLRLHETDRVDVIQHAWTYAATNTGMACVIRLVVSARQVMPEPLPLTLT